MSLPRAVILSPAKSWWRKGDLIAGRYRVERELGRGGMAAVYHVVDVVESSAWALKALQPVPDGVLESGLHLFEREFYNLVHLAHPRVVQVADYYHDEVGSAYYTMELLDGRDLWELAPAPYHRVCALLGDICSALSLLHSRRQIHCDVTPRNIRCTADGRAKLIDFGALMTFGPIKQIVGTPSCCAPEMLAGEFVDGRADIFALGASAYFALTGRHAYAAATFSQLRDVWLRAPAPPSHFAGDIPEALDRLVLAMLQLDPLQRPASVADVLERLCAIAGIELDEDLVVRQAYLTTPLLVGRDECLAVMRSALLGKAPQATPVGLVVGEPGWGRSRVLAVLALEAQLHGLDVVRLDGEQLSSPFAGVDALLGRLAALSPDFLRLGGRASVVHHRTQDARAARNRSIENLRRAKLNALREAMETATERRPVLITVDDVADMDEHSIALLALLAFEVAANGALSGVRILVTALRQEIKAPSTALALLLSNVVRFDLEPLTGGDVRSLLVSIFGEVPYVGLLAENLYREAAGEPGTVMELAQHLVDAGAIHYTLGRWLLPPKIDRELLPPVDMAIDRRLSRLGASELALAQAMACCEDLNFVFDELVLLSGGQNTPKVMVALERLVSAGIIRSDGTSYLLAGGRLGERLRRGVDGAQRQVIHGRIARVYQALRARPLFAVVHWVRSGDKQRAIAVLWERWCAAPGMYSEWPAVVGRVPDWPEIFGSLLPACDQHPRARGCRLVIHFETFHACLWATRFSGTQGVLGDSLRALVATLAEDAGLAVLSALGSAASRECIERALEEVEARYETLPAAQQGCPPRQAIDLLLRVQMVVASAGMTYLDPEFLGSLPSLESLSLLSPKCVAVQCFVEGAKSFLAGRLEKAAVAWQAGLELVMGLIGEGVLDDVVLMAAGVLQVMLGHFMAVLGQSRALRWARELDKFPRLQPYAARVRMVHAFCSGDVAAGRELAQQFELLWLRESDGGMGSGGEVVLLGNMAAQCLSYAACDDLWQLRQLLPEVHGVARCYPGWQAVVEFVEGHCHRIRGEYRLASAWFRAGLQRVNPGDNWTWIHHQAGLIDCLWRDGELSEAVRQGEAAVLVASAEAITGLPLLQQVLAQAYLVSDQVEQAVELAQLAVDGWARMNGGGTLYGAALEIRARAAARKGDMAGFERFARQCAQVYDVGRNNFLTARHDALMREAYPLMCEQVTGASLGLASTVSGEAVREVLRVLCQRSGAEHVVFYVLGDSGLGFLADSEDLSAEDGSLIDTAALAQMAREHLAAEVAEEVEVTRTIDDQSLLEQQVEVHEGRWVPTLIGHRVDGREFITGVALWWMLPGTRLQLSPDWTAVVSGWLERSQGVTAMPYPLE